MTSALYTLSAGLAALPTSRGRATTGSANALASTRARFADATRTLQIRQFWTTCSAASQDFGADQIGSRVSQVHRPCFIRGTECSTRLSLSFGRIMCTLAENSGAHTRNP